MAFEFFGRAKLLLGGEYLVLDGADALAVGLDIGQWLTVEDAGGDCLHWESFEKDGSLWFEARFDKNAGILSASHCAVAETLSAFLKTCLKHNPGFSFAGKKARIRAGFDRSWGFGSSSTLIYVLARWADIDPFALVREVLPGSGYDVACAGIVRGNAVVYSLAGGRPLWEEIVFAPPFADELFFVYSGAKQDTREAVARYRSLPQAIRAQAAAEATQIVRGMLTCSSLIEFEGQMIRHEALVGSLLGLRPVGEDRFSDYAGGAVKSLGAWGGDFLLATGKAAPDYFRANGYGTVLSFNGIVKK